VERRGPAAHDFVVKTGGRGVRTNASIGLQDLRRRIYIKAKAEPSWRFWGSGSRAPWFRLEEME
jgi:RNA-directed DNA polymerase